MKTSMGNFFNQIRKDFSNAFWVANFVELLERAAYYGFFVVITVYLSKIYGFSDIEAGFISGIFSAGLYLLPLFAGAYADKIGFRKSMLLAFALLFLGYLGLAILPAILENAGLINYRQEKPDFGLLQSTSAQWLIVPILMLIMLGGSFIKSVITGSVAKETSTENRARGFAIFYMMVNIGAFSGKLLVEPLRANFGDMGLVYINYFGAFATLFALVVIYFMYKTKADQTSGKSMAEVWSGLVKVLLNFRLLTLTLIISGFWLVQGQMYATMPKYVLRMIGEESTPGWYANVNPFIVVVFVSLVTQFMRKYKAINSMLVGLCILPFSAIIMALGNMTDGTLIVGMHPIAFTMVIGIVIQGFAETFISPRYFEYFSLQAPKGEEGLYLGFSQLHSFFSYLFAFIISGYLLDRYCPDQSRFEVHADWVAATNHAHYIWFVFAGVAFFTIIALYVFAKMSPEKKSV